MIHVMILSVSVSCELLGIFLLSIEHTGVESIKWTEPNLPLFFLILEEENA